MATRINRLPRGLLSLLDIQAMGENPRELSPVVVPTIDMLPFYAESAALNVLTDTVVLNTNTQDSNFTFIATPAGISASASVIEVPRGEAWCVLAWACYAAMNDPAQLIDFGPVVNNPANATVRMPATSTFGPEDTTGLPAGIITFGRWRTINDPFWVSPGDRLEGRVAYAVVPTGQIDLTMRLRIVRLAV